MNNDNVTRILLRDSITLRTSYQPGTECEPDASTAPVNEWRYRFNPLQEREQKRQYLNANGPADGLAWTYTLLGADARQLATYNGIQGPLCNQPAGTVWLWPVEYNAYGPANTRVILRPNGAKDYAIADHLGSVRLLLGDDGVIKEQRSYGPFGEDLISDGDGARTSYIGRENDNESNLGFFGVRHYDPTYGRFMSVDPLWAQYAPLQPYHYAGNEPVGQLDWSGRDYDVIFGEDENGKATVTVSARFYVKKEDVTDLKAALDKIEEKAGMIVKVDGKDFVVAFDLEPLVVDEPNAELNESASRECVDDYGITFDQVPETNTNSFRTGKLGANNPGLTTGGRAITVDPSQSGCSAESVVVHEVLHTLGVSHKNAGVMTASCTHKQHSPKIFDGFIETMVKGSDKADDPGVGTRTVKGK